MNAPAIDAAVNSVARLSERLERLAQASRVFLSMPLIEGITPRYLVANGHREDCDTQSGLTRCSGTFLLSEVGLPVFDHGLLYGDAVFEGVTINEGRIFQWREHLARLFSSAAAVRITIPYTPERLTNHILEAARTVHFNTKSATYLRLIVTRGIGDLAIAPTTCVGSSICCIASQVQLYPQHVYDHGLRLRIARHIRRQGRQTLDPRIKSCNYLNNIFGLLETSDPDTHEALMLTQEGWIAEATADNVFSVRRDDGWRRDPSKVVIITPSREYCLNGITRDLVIRYARERGYRIQENAQMLPSDLFGDHKELFLTGTAAGIAPVTEIDGSPIANGEPGPITRQLRDMLKVDMVRDEMGLPLRATSDDVEHYFLGRSSQWAQRHETAHDLITTMFEVIDLQSWTDLETFFHEDVVYERPGYDPIRGIQNLMHFYKERRVIASGTHELEGITADREYAACWGRFVGTHKDGSPLDERFSDVYTVKNGQIATRRSFFFRPAV